MPRTIIKHYVYECEGISNGTRCSHTISISTATYPEIVHNLQSDMIVEEHGWRVGRGSSAYGAKPFYLCPKHKHQRRFEGRKEAI